MKKKVLAFGVFDGLHEGHKSFLKQAKALGDYLIVVVTRDEVVKQLKGRFPKLRIAERFHHLKKADHVDAVVLGDNELGRWNVLDIHRPQVIALGHDQGAIKKELQRLFRTTDWKARMVTTKEHKRR